MKKYLPGFMVFILINSFVISVHAADTWSYKVTEDKMTGSAMKVASLRSDNALNLQFPYKESENYGLLTIRQMEGEPVDVLVTIRKGQILCPGYGDGCTVAVRFDNDKPIRFDAIGPSDHRSTAFFIQNTSRFLLGAKKAKRILIQFTMYNAGEQMLEFNPAQSLEWAGVATKKR